MDEFMARYFVLLQMKTIFILMVISALGTLFDYSRWVWAEKHRVRVAISGALLPDHKDDKKAREQPCLCLPLTPVAKSLVSRCGLAARDGSELEFPLDRSARCLGRRHSDGCIRRRMLVAED